MLIRRWKIVVDASLRTSVVGLYAADMIIAASQGAIAGQAINRDLFEPSLRNHAIPSFAYTPH